MEQGQYSIVKEDYSDYIDLPRETILVVIAQNTKNTYTQQVISQFIENLNNGIINRPDDIVKIRPQDVIRISVAPIDEQNNYMKFFIFLVKQIPDELLKNKHKQVSVANMVYDIFTRDGFILNKQQIIHLTNQDWVYQIFGLHYRERELLQQNKP